jgi:hypothetical protein
LITIVNVIEQNSNFVNHNRNSWKDKDKIQLLKKNYLDF